MPNYLQLDVVTPERRLVSERVEWVNVPGRNGELGILPDHAPMISELGTGLLTYIHNGSTIWIHVSGGFVEVNNDRVSVLAEIAELPDEIDTAAARIDREKAEKAMAEFGGDEDELDTLTTSLERSIVRQQLGSGSSTVQS